MLLDSGAHGKHIDIENDVLGPDSGLLREQCPGPPADFNLPAVSRCLAFLVKCHHHHRGSQLADFPGLGQERLLAFLEADGIDNRPPLGILQTCQYGIPMRRVDHQGRLGHCRLAGNLSHELLHAVPAVQHRIVHIDVNDAGPVLDLLRRHFESASIVACRNELRELSGTGHVGALSHIGEVVVFQVNADRFQSADGKDPGAP